MLGTKIRDKERGWQPRNNRQEQDMEDMKGAQGGHDNNKKIRKI